MTNLILILLSGFAATSVMTALSYFMANLKKSQFREPELLNILIPRARSTTLEIPKNHPAGWIIHYAIGCFFVLIFHLLWKYTNLPVSLWSGAGFGFYSRNYRDLRMDHFL